MNPANITIAKARPSSTVIVVRDGKTGPELLLVLRHAKSAFGASYVFPGGVLEATDDRVGELREGVDDAGANAVLNLSSGGGAYFSAAIRELFEEAGILLARTADGNWADPCSYPGARDGLNGGQLSWIDFLHKEQLNLAYDALHYFSFWVTPREMPKRFTTRFFLAALPGGQEAAHCGGELTDSRWMTAAAAIAASEAGEIEIPHPTVLTLRRLSEFDTARSMLDWAAGRSEAGIPCYLPAVVIVDGCRLVVMPDSPLYPVYPADE
ncbi:MAG: NUDIX domain-containing protein [Gammaproteobacteria bacterium]|nr:NUDIX domain-containing protein [Gammaproteobacteria bacterium]